MGVVHIYSWWKSTECEEREGRVESAVKGEDKEAQDASCVRKIGYMKSDGKIQAGEKRDQPSFGRKRECFASRRLCVCI